MNLITVTLLFCGAAWSHSFHCKAPGVSNRLIMASFGLGGGEGLTLDRGVWGLGAPASGGRWAGGWAQSSVFIFLYAIRVPPEREFCPASTVGPYQTREFFSALNRRRIAAFFFFTLFGFFHGE
jgi:hypothetical protein